MDDDVLHGYLQHHWVGATATLDLFRRVADGHADPQVADEVRGLSAEIAEDRAALRTTMEAVGAPPSAVGTVVGKVGERVGRLKPNGRLLTRSPLTDLVEIEALHDAVFVKRGGWDVLRAVAEDDPRLDVPALDELLDRADGQLERLRRLHLRVARERLAP